MLAFVESRRSCYCPPRLADARGFEVATHVGLKDEVELVGLVIDYLRALGVERIILLDPRRKTEPIRCWWNRLGRSKK